MISVELKSSQSPVACLSTLAGFRYPIPNVRLRPHFALGSLFSIIKHTSTSRELSVYCCSGGMFESKR